MLATLIATAVAASAPIQVASNLVFHQEIEAPDVLFEEAPIVTDAADRRLVQKLGDGFSIVSCKGVSRAGRLESCVAIKWNGQNPKLDAIALRALNRARVSKQQISTFKRQPDDVLTTIRFSDSPDPPTIACPPIWCQPTVPPPPPPPPPPPK